MQKLRVTIPKRKRELITLAQNVLDKHQRDAENSMLSALNWEDVASKVQQVTALHDEAAVLSRRVKQINEQRDLLLADLKDHMRDSRDVLTGIFKKEMKHLGKWGYTVTESPRRTKQKKEMNDVN